MLAAITLGLIAWRYSGCSVSGSRRYTQIPTTTAMTAIPLKIQRQLATSSTAWPKVGASIGTIMNTTEMVDIIRAIASPLKRSRMIAAGRTASPALNSAWSARSTSSAVKSRTMAQASDSTI